jgi:hypothetical protein
MFPSSSGLISTAGYSVYKSQAVGWSAARFRAWRTFIWRIMDLKFPAKRNFWSRSQSTIGVKDISAKSVCPESDSTSGESPVH